MNSSLTLDPTVQLWQLLQQARSAAASGDAPAALRLVLQCASLQGAAPGTLTPILSRLGEALIQPHAPGVSGGSSGNSSQQGPSNNAAVLSQLEQLFASLSVQAAHGVNASRVLAHSHAPQGPMQQSDQQAVNTTSPANAPMSMSTSMSMSVSGGASISDGCMAEAAGGGLQQVPPGGHALHAQCSTPAWSHVHPQEDEATSMRRGTNDPILMETGREGLAACALGDGSHYTCSRCGGVVPLHRRQQHEQHWCQP